MITELAPAKINLALHVRARRPDGYHEIETLFAFCRDGDTVTVAEAAEDTFTVTGTFAPALAGESGNLILAARDVFAAAFGPLLPLAITLDKQIPVASGIGGGSADAAATLRALGRLRGVSPGDMADVALSLGSDVPACLFGQSAVGGGRGEHLTPVEGLTDTPVLLVNPGVAVSTAQVFAGWGGNSQPNSSRHPGLYPGSISLPAVDSLLDECRIKSGMTDWIEVVAAGRNDLEAPARAIAPVIGDVLDLLARQPGVTLARMSGSGATCFALFETDAARAAARSAMHPDWWCLESTLA